MVTPRHVVLVEGRSDRAALHALARREGRDLIAEGVAVVTMGGVTNIRSFACHYGPPGLGLPLAGLYDEPAETWVRRGLAAAGLPGAPATDDLTALGFFACRSDLEDELIRAHGVARVEELIETAGESRSLRLLTAMPAQRAWPREAVLKRFLGVRSGRKARYAALLVEALEHDQAPSPLAAVLAHVSATGAQ